MVKITALGNTPRPLWGGGNTSHREEFMLGPCYLQDSGNQFDAAIAEETGQTAKFAT